MLVTQLSIEVADQVGAPRGVAVAYFRRRNAVSPEESESLSQFTPAGHDPCVVHEVELNRPNDTLSLAPLAIDVADREPPASSHRRPERIKRHPVLWKTIGLRAGNGHRQGRGDLPFLGQDR